MAIDFEALKISATFENEMFDTKKIVSTVPIRKPKKMDYFRVREGAEWVYDTYIVAPDDSGEDEKYLVLPDFMKEIKEHGMLKPVRFFALITYGTRVFFLSEVGLPDEEGKWNSWNRSRMETYELAKKEWANITSDRALGAWTVRLPVSKLPDPEWPERPANIFEALELAFKDKIIDSDDHPVLNRLRGKV